MDEIPTTVKNKELVEKRRVQIVLSAIKLFSRNGFHKTTLRDLSEEAGFSYGNIYDYIGSKEDIFYLIHNYLCDLVFEELQRATENIDDPLEKLRRMVRAEFNFMDRWSDGILLLYQEGHILSPPFLHNFLKKEHEHIAMFEKVIRECVQKGFLRGCNPKLAANLIKTTVDGWVLKRWDLRGSASSQEAEKFILDMILFGLLPKKLDRRSAFISEMNPLSGKRALVVGGEKAIGAASIQAVTAAGASVFAVVNDKGYMDPHHDLNWGGNVKCFKSSEYGPLGQTLFSRIEKESGPFDIYIHDLGAGVPHEPLFVEKDSEVDNKFRILEENLQSAHDIAQHLIKLMPQRPWSRLIYIAPWAWDVSLNEIGFYSALAGTVALAGSLSRKLYSSRVNVNCIIPGYIKAPRPFDWWNSNHTEVNPESYGELSDVTNSILFLLGDKSRNLTNQVIKVACGNIQPLQGVLELC